MHTLLTFLEQLSAHNTTTWMHANQPAYQEAKQTLLAMAQTLINQIGAFDTTLGELYPAETVFRLAKDTRFSKDKSPYKTNFGIVIAPWGKKSIFPCYYVHLQPGNHSFLAAGLYRPESRIQKAVRDHLIHQRAKFHDIITQDVFVSTRWSIEGDAYKKMPPWYPADHPATDLIKQKDWLIHIPLSDKDVSSSSFLDKTIHSFAIACPFNQRLHEAIRLALLEGELA